jgi:hypothetical protein
MPAFPVKAACDAAAAVTVTSNAKLGDSDPSIFDFTNIKRI